MASAFITYGQSRVHYLHFGTGPERIIALHGYGESSASFLFLEEYVGTAFTIIAIDLPFHGDTRWEEKRAFTGTDMTLILVEILKDLGIEKTRFILMGYSMGGRLALWIAENLSQQVSRLLLLAPDGMKTNFWYWLATQTILGMHLFRFTMKHPKWFFVTLDMANRCKLINKSIYKFIYCYLDNKELRIALYHRWTCMRKFKPDLKKLRSIIERRKLPVRLLYGKHDRIILSKRARHLYQGLDAYCQLKVIDAGHQVLQKKYAPVISKLLTT